jgi:hypothetical protein
MKPKCSATIDIPESREHDCQQKVQSWTWSAGKPFCQYFIECFLFSSLKLCTELSSPVTLFHKNSLASGSYHNIDCCLMCPFASVSVPQLAFVVPVLHTAFSILNWQLMPSLAHMKWQFHLLFLLLNLPHLDNFRNTVLLNFISCCSKSSAMLLVIQAGTSEVCTVDMYSPLNSTDIYTVILIKNFHLPMNVSQWNIFSSHNSVTACCLFHTVVISLYCTTFGDL